MHNKNLMLVHGKRQIQEQVINNLLDDHSEDHVTIALNVMFDIFYGQICNQYTDMPVDVTMYGGEILSIVKNEQPYFKELCLSYDIEAIVDSTFGTHHRCEVGYESYADVGAALEQGIEVEDTSCSFCTRQEEHVETIIDLATALLRVHDYQPQNRQFLADVNNRLSVTIMTMDAVYVMPMTISTNPIVLGRPLVEMEKRQCVLA